MSLQTESRQTESQPTELSLESNVKTKRPRSLRRFIFLLLLVLVVITIILSFFLLRFYRPYGTGPAGPAVDGSAFNDVWSERPIILFGMGDSITAGFGVQADHGYVARLAENPDDEFDDMKGKCLKNVLSNLTVINKAVSGSTSIQHLKYLEENTESFAEEEFGLVVLTTGGNDLIHFYGQSPPREGAMYGATVEQAEPWIENFRNRLNSIIEKLNEKFPGGCLIFLANIYDPTDDVGDAASVFLPTWPDGTAILACYNQVIDDCAQDHPNVFLVPLYEGFLGHGTHCSEPWRKHYCASDPTCWFGGNIEDPNVRGFDATRRLFLNEIVRQRDQFK